MAEASERRKGSGRAAFKLVFPVLFVVFVVIMSIRSERSLLLDVSVFSQSKAIQAQVVEQPAMEKSRLTTTTTASSQQPAASSQQPAASSQQPAASSQQPAASSQQPGTKDRRGSAQFGYRNTLARRSIPNMDRRTPFWG
jgi:hypothetical protein